MKWFSSLLVFSILMAGCASNPAGTMLKPSSNFRRPSQNAPYVEFLGDSQTLGLLAYAHEVSWQCHACQPSATSGDLLAALPGVLALHPDAIHLMTGDLELSAPGANRGAAVIANVEAMVTAIQAAKIPLVIGLLPQLQTYTPYYENLGLQFLYGNQYGPPAVSLVPLIDYPDAVYAVDPQAVTLTATDYAVMLPLTQAAITALHANQPK
jgi:hypothetical protein